MKILINKEDVFQARGSKVAIAATTSGYTLQYSVDGRDFDDYADPVPAAENLIVSDVITGMFFKLAGNTDDNVTIRF
jgi:hypothetical protein